MLYLFECKSKKHKLVFFFRSEEEATKSIVTCPLEECWNNLNQNEGIFKYIPKNGERVQTLTEAPSAVLIGEYPKHK